MIVFLWAAIAKKTAPKRRDAASQQGGNTYRPSQMGGHIHETGIEWLRMYCDDRKTFGTGKTYE